MSDLLTVQSTEGPPPPPTILDLLDARRVKFTEPPQEPITIFSINGQSLSTSGNLTVISGQSKAGKSAVITSMIAGPIAKAGGDFLGFDAAPADGKIILVFDTEQSPYHAWTLLTRALRRAGCDTQPDNLHYYYVLDLSIAQRREAVTAACRRAAESPAGVYCVFIDGLADLVENVNDAAESNAVVAEMVHLAVEIKAPVVVVLHENPATRESAGKTRGHLGSQLERKAESNLRVVKDADGVSTVFGDKCRTAYIPQHTGPQFSWCDDLQRHVTNTAKRETKAELERASLIAQVDEIYDDSAAAGGYSHSELLLKIGDVFALKHEGAKKRLAKYRNALLVKKSSSTGLWIRA